MTKFKKRPGKEADQFISGVKKPGNMETLTIRINPDVLHRLRALSYLKKNLSQREIIETALDWYFKENKADLERAERLYKELE